MPSRLPPSAKNVFSYRQQKTRLAVALKEKNQETIEVLFFLREPSRRSFLAGFSCSMTSWTQPFRAFSFVRLSSSCFLGFDLRGAVARPDGSFISSEAGKVGKKGKRPSHQAGSASPFPPEAHCFFNLTGSLVCFFFFFFFFAF